MVQLSEDAKKFLEIWRRFSPYAENLVRIVNVKNDCRIYFTLEGWNGNIGSYEYHLRPDDLSGFETMEDGKEYTFEELI